MKSAHNRVAGRASVRPLTSVLPVIIRVMPIVAPRRISSVASVTMNEGRRVFTTSQPLNAPMARANSERQDHGERGRQAELDDEQPDGDARRADHRADREVELAGDHQQRDRDADDADLGRDLEEARRALDGQEALPTSPGDRETAKIRKTRRAPMNAPNSGLDASSRVAAERSAAGRSRAR